MDFQNTEIAYKLKSNRQLLKTLFIFRLISNSVLVSICTKIITWSLRFNLPISEILDKTVFKQFCAGIDEKDSIKIVKKLKKLNVNSYMHYASEGVESEKDFDNNFKIIIRTIDITKKNTALPFTVFKASSLGKFNLFEKKSAGSALSEIEKQLWNKTIDRIKSCCKHAARQNVRIFIDAEESWIQPIIDEIAESLMEKFNKEKTIIYTTLQMYRKDRLKYLNKLIQNSIKKNYNLGFKLVRGAYMEKENERASKSGLPSPIFENKNLTDLSFNNALDKILLNIERCDLFVGTHCEKSIIKILKWMKVNKISNGYKKIWFSQLFGMADHISFNLASRGYQVVKYVPYGPIKKVVPYLIRRAEENTSINSQLPKEINLIKREIKRRKFNAI